MPKKNKGTPMQSRPSGQRLESLDLEIIRLLQQRARLLGQSARGRQERQRSRVDANQEKALWKAWYRELVEHGFEEKTVRTIFNAANALAYEQDERTDSWSFPLRAYSGPVRLDIPGPPDTRMTRIWLAMSALTGSRSRIPQAVQNDWAYELMKAFNQAGAAFAWDRESFSHEGEADLDFDKKSIFAGQDPFNFYLLALSAARQPCSCKFTGSGNLKFMDLKPLFDLAPALGARLVPLLPGSHGLPLRLEASGDIAESIQLPSHAPLELGLALAVTASTVSSHPAVHIGWPSGWPHGPGMERVLSLLEPSFSLDRGQSGLTISTGRPKLPETAGLPLDPLLAAYMLGLPAMAGGQARLQGSYPDWLPEGEEALAMFRAVGLDCQLSRETVCTTASDERPSCSSLNCASTGQLLPLGLALGLACPENTQILAGSEEQAESADELMRALGLDCHRSGTTLTLSGSVPGNPEEVRLFGPDPFWLLGLALISLRRSRIVLTNPGDLTELWPQFWTLYKNLPAPEAGPKPPASGKEAGHGSKKRRRIVE
jgi:3-phosphoshikimate 1-carboxyvinyltransferase